MKLYIKPVGVNGTNCYIVADNDGTGAVIDPGGQPEKLIAFLKQSEITPKYVLLTHGHFDHIGGVKAIVKEFECKIVIGANDAEQLADRNKSLAIYRDMTEEDYVMSPDLLVREGDTITAGELVFDVFDTPGHTRGGVTYRCGKLLFTGDTLFAGDVGRADLYGGDYSVLLKSVKKLAALEGDYHVLPGHGPDSMMDEERKKNRYITGSQYDNLY